MMNRLEDMKKYQEELIHTLESVPLNVLDNQFHRYMAIIKHKCGRRISPGTGFSMNYHVARSHAVGEAIERYCAGIMNPADIVNETINDLDFRGISPTTSTDTQLNNMQINIDMKFMMKRKNEIGY